MYIYIFVVWIIVTYSVLLVSLGPNVLVCLEFNGLEITRKYPQ